MVKNIEDLPYKAIFGQVTEIWEIYYTSSILQNSPFGMVPKNIDYQFAFTFCEEEADKLMSENDKIKLHKRLIKVALIGGEYFILRQFYNSPLPNKSSSMKPNNFKLSKEELDFILDSIGQPKE